jgi:crotonobetainyl-CoA:carnitine CoA-transferase CaiB-like acyl-CoA transferase
LKSLFRTLLATLDRFFPTGPREKWVESLRKADIVSAPINTPRGVERSRCAGEWIYHAGRVSQARQKVEGPWLAVEFSETPAKAGIPPKVGEHKEEVLKEIGTATRISKIPR